MGPGRGTISVGSEPGPSMLLSQASTVFCLRVLSLPDGSYALIDISPKRKQQKNGQNVTTLL